MQVVDLAVSVAADEALCDIYLCTLVLLKYGSQLLLDVGWVWLRVLVGAHEVECREQCGVDALLLHVVGNHVGAHYLTLSYDALLLKAGEELFGERAQILEHVGEESACGVFPLLCGVEFLNVLHIFLLKLVDDLVSSLGILLVEIVGNLDKRVGCSRHGGEDDEHRLA